MTVSGRVLAGVLLVWLLGTVWWATQPLEDHVPTGVVEGERTTQAVDCHAPLSRDSSVRGTLPELEPPRAYQREPCQEPMRSAGYLLLVDLVFLAACLVAYWLVISRRAAAEEPRRDSAQSAAPA